MNYSKFVFFVLVMANRGKKRKIEIDDMTENEKDDEIRFLKQYVKDIKVSINILLSESVCLLF